MARIPVIQAPQLNAGVGEIALTPGAPNAPDLSGVAKNLLQGQLQQGSFDGEAEGLAQVGKGLQYLGAAGEKVASVINDGKQRMQAASDAANLVKIGALRNEAWAKFEATKNPNEPDKWAEQWGKVNSDLDSQISSYPLSEQGRQKYELETVQFNSDANVRLITSSAKQTAQNISNTYTEAFNTALSIGDYEKAGELNGQSLSVGAQTQAQFNENKAAISTKQTDDLIATSIRTDPRGLKDEMDAGLKGEQTPWSERIPKDRMLAVYQQANAEVNRRESDSAHLLLDGIATNQIQDEQQLAAANEKMGGYVSPSTLKSFNTALVKEIRYDPGTMVQAEALINQDFTNDQKAGSPKYRQALDFIATRIPKDMQADIRSRLKENYNSTLPGGSGRTPKQSFWSQWSSNVNSNMKDGAYGDMGYSKKKGEKNKVVDFAKNGQTTAKVYGYMEQMRQWANTHPEATPDDFNKKWSDIILPDAALEEKKRFDLLQERQKMFPYRPFALNDPWSW